MKSFRKFMVFLLFIALFGVTVYSVFSRPLDDMAENVRSGLGKSIYIDALEGADGNVYAIKANMGGSQGYRLVAVNAAGRIYDRELKRGLPAKYEIDSLHVCQDGKTMVLGVYEATGASLTSLSIYTATDGESFTLLKQQPLEGATADAQRGSARIVGMREEAGLVYFTICHADGNDNYVFDRAKGQGVIAKGSADDSFVAAFDKKSLDDCEAATMLLGGSPLDSAKITSLAPCADGGALAIKNNAELYRLDATGEMTDLTPSLYRTKWQSALTLLLLVLVVIVVSYGFYYLVCEVRKLYFPLVVRNFLTLSLIGFVIVSAILTLFIVPKYREGNRQAAQGALLTVLSGFEGTQDHQAFKNAAAAIAVNPEYVDTTLTLYAKKQSDGYGILESSADNKRILTLALKQPSIIAGERGMAAMAAEKGPRTLTVQAGDKVFYCAYMMRADGTVLSARVNAVVLESKIDAALLEIAILCYGMGLLLVGLALLALGGAARGMRRVTKGVDLLLAGNIDVHVVNNSGDEAEALAKAFNDLARSSKEALGTADIQNDSYLRFVPSQLVALLGAGSVEAIDKNTSVSRTQAMMVVWFKFPEDIYKSDAHTLFESINTVFERAGGVVAKGGGTIYNFTYDGFDAVFESDSQAALSAAVGIRQEILDLNSERDALGQAPVELRVALDKGVALMGVVGDQNRVVPTVVSACLTTARRLVKLAHSLDANILCTEAVAQMAKEYHVRYIGKINDGEAILRVHEAFDGDPYQVRMVKESTRAQFSLGLYTLYSHDFPGAKRIFMDIARRQNDDGVARHYLYLADKCEKLTPDEVMPDEVYLN